MVAANAGKDYILSRWWSLKKGRRSFPSLVVATLEEIGFGKGRGKCRWDYISHMIGPTSKAPHESNPAGRCGFESRRWNVA